jgi:hypothetical protein
MVLCVLNESRLKGEITVSRIGKSLDFVKSISHNGGESLKTNYHNGHNSIKVGRAKSGAAVEKSKVKET